MQSPDIITFEQPANEHIRVCLRLEHLLHKALYFLNGHSQWESRACLTSIIEILQLLDRPDLRNKLAQEISRQLSNLQRLSQTPGVDHSRLDHTIQELENINTTLHANNGKFGSKLRSNELIQTIIQNYSNPAGTCEYNTPGYHLWLEQSANLRIKQLTQWLDSFSDIFQLMRVMLRLVRECAVPVKQTAKAGFFQINLDPQAPCQLVRIEVPLAYNVFPKASIGRYGLVIRFHESEIDKRAHQTELNIDFNLSCCIF